MQSKNAIVINSGDNVAVAIEAIPAGGAAVCELDGRRLELPVPADLPIYHKLALRPIAQGEAVVKYGEHIGVAARAIAAGEHIHTHNLLDHREDLREGAQP